MNKNAINAAMAIRRIHKLLAEGEQTNTTFSKELAVINANVNLSQEGKRHSSEKEAAVAYTKFRRLAGFAKESLNDLKAARIAAINDFRYDDPKLQSALHTISVSGTTLPRSIQGQIVDDFRGNPTALSVLKPIYEKSRWYVGNINKYCEIFTTDEAALFKPLQTLITCAGAEPSTISKAMGIDVHPKWDATGVADLLKRFELAFGIDASRSPYIVELEQMRDKLPVGSVVRDRIERCLRLDGEALEEDDPETIKIVERRISQNFEYAKP